MVRRGQWEGLGQYSQGPLSKLLGVKKALTWTFKLSGEKRP